MRYLSALALAILVVAPAAAQQVDIKKPVPSAPPREIEREPRVIEPGLSRESRPIETDNYPPHGGRAPHEPGFFRGLSSKTATGRVGIAGWTAPNVPVGSSGSGWREINGWLTIGFSATWDAPPPAAPRAAP